MTNLPKKYFASARGQVLILFLLILVLAMSIVVSISSRTVTEIEVTTTSDDSNKAYFAAEAGVEEALEHYKTDIPAMGDPPIHLSFDNSTSATTTVSTGGVRDNFVYPNLVDRDDVAQVMMLNDPNNLDSGWCPPPAAAGDCVVTIYWGTDPAGANGNKQAIEVSVVYYYIESVGWWHSGPGVGNGEWRITKFAVSASPPPFCKGGAQPIPGGEERVDLVSGVAFTFFYKTDIDLRSSPPPASPISGCAVANQGGTVGDGQIALMRIRPLFNLQAIPIAVSSTSPQQIPNQGVTLESVGSTTSGVTRKIQVTTLYPSMPAIFDYVLFNGGNSALTK